MNGIPSFRDLAELAMRDSSLAHMRPTVEKELLHYKIFLVLDKGGLLNDLVFLGGAAPRLCYGAPRLSEDLGISAGAESSASHLEGELAKRPNPNVSVEQPKSASSSRPSKDVRVATGLFGVEPRPGRRDAPRQNVRLNVDNSPVHTRGCTKLRGTTKCSASSVR